MPVDLVESAPLRVVAMLRDGAQKVRQAARTALRTSPHSALCVPPLLEMVVDPDPWMREHAFKALAVVPQHVDAHVAAVGPALSDEDPCVRIAALRLIESVPGVPARQMSEVFRLLADEEASVREAALQLLATKPHRGKRSSCADAVAKAVSDEDPWVRAAAVRTANALLSPSELGDAVLPALRDEHYCVRAAALGALSTIARCGARVEQHVVELAGDIDAGVRRAAMKALAQMPAVARALVGLAVSALEDDEAKVREAALKALGVAGHQSGPYLPLVQMRLADSYIAVREAALRVLVAAGPAALKAHVDQTALLALGESGTDLRNRMYRPTALALATLPTGLHSADVGHLLQLSCLAYDAP